ncbi:N-formylglutamate amidohydrolase [Devosia rhodophyticola]|uniref:N-formylglutamate amidohydrolase n=1 Tax=Devosia rhodophyticola TaxID=3026423 RepID=A0ABY7YZF7_9HYPH|nr:N-formylglutamate amidohydrolase [Devosia rhodophyticola]WDR06734.1 N-formylglutamate amidohydrolase [Devosia rhodophyticola]
MVDEVADHRLAARQVPPVLVVNGDGASPFVLVCDHASNRLPERYGDLGLSQTQRLSHIAWDPGALAVCHQMVDRLDAPLIHSTVSRLIIDANRDIGSPELIRTVSETTEIAANLELSPEERQSRISQFHTPFHDVIGALLNRRAAAGKKSVLVCMHSFTPSFMGVGRPWPIGLIHGKDQQFTHALQDALKAEDPGLNVGWNEPYAAMNGVTFTLEEHGDRRGIDATMIELRNDEITEPDGVSHWAGRLARCLETARQASVS